MLHPNREFNNLKPAWSSRSKGMHERQSFAWNIDSPPKNVSRMTSRRIGWTSEVNVMFLMHCLAKGLVVYSLPFQFKEIWLSEKKRIQILLHNRLLFGSVLFFLWSTEHHTKLLCSGLRRALNESREWGSDGYRWKDCLSVPSVL